MKHEGRYASLTELAAAFDVSQDAVAARLQKVGFCTSWGSPSFRAFREGLITERWRSGHPHGTWAGERGKTAADERGGWCE